MSRSQPSLLHDKPALIIASRTYTKKQQVYRRLFTLHLCLQEWCPSGQLSTERLISRRLRMKRIHLPLTQTVSQFLAQKTNAGENIGWKIFFMALIIFDFDGVLADTLDDLIQFGQEVCDELGVRHIVNKDDLSNLESMSFASFGQSCEVPEHLADEFVQRCLKRFAEKKSPPAIFNGLSHVVRDIAAHNTIAIITSNTSQAVNAFLIEHDLVACVHAVYGIDSLGSKAQKISIARDQFSADTKRDSVLMVGDSLSDIRAAKEASVTSIAVTWGHQSLEHLLRGNPDYVVRCPHDFIEVINKIA